jgi:catechol 2,3-dioxygenase-like lactoylglutathione lyase family enzyme
MLGLRHLNLNVSNLERSVSFYTACFGLLEIERSQEAAVEKHGRVQGLRQAVLSSPRTRELLALTEWEEAPVGPGGLDHFGFVLESDEELPRLLSLVRAHGGSIGRTGVREVRGCSEAFAYVKDPDGYAIELATQAALYSRLAEGPGE